LAKAGSAVLVISQDLDEILEILGPHRGDLARGGCRHRTMPEV